MYFMSDPQALHVTRNVIPGKLGVDLHLHRVHIPLVSFISVFSRMLKTKLALNTTDNVRDCIAISKRTGTTVCRMLRCSGPEI